MSVEIITADCLDALPRLAADGFRAHAVVTDPPYHLIAGGIGLRSMTVDGKGNAVTSAARGGFMNAKWDGGDVAFRPETWAAVRECMLPGAHLVAFSGTRTSHRMVCAIEDAGFEIRDTLMWVYGSGFPKNLNVSMAIDRAAGAERDVVGPPPYTRGRAGQSYSDTRRVRWDYAPQPITTPATPEAAAWAGWGTALKPAVEMICLARKPLSEGSVAANVLRHGTGAINVDACRVGTDDGANRARPPRTPNAILGGGKGTNLTSSPHNDIGRYPANLLHDGSPEVEQAFAAFGTSQTGARSDRSKAAEVSGTNWLMNNHQSQEYTDTGSASRFFYTAKADANDRQGSRHPTVKPASLMRWLVRLVCPAGGTILDPFAGTGSSGLAADQLGMDAVLIERDAQYAADARRKIERDGGLFADVREPYQMAAEPAMRDLFAEAAD